jgi:hypothetical protein
MGGSTSGEKEKKKKESFMGAALVEKKKAYIIENWDKLGHPKPWTDTYSSKQKIGFCTYCLHLGLQCFSSNSFTKRNAVMIL